MCFKYIKYISKYKQYSNTRAAPAVRALFSMTAINTILWCIWVKSNAHVDLASLALQVAPVSYYINSKKNKLGKFSDRDCESN